MRRPSPRMTPNQLTISKGSFTMDAAGARQPNYTAPGPVLSVSVQAASESDVPWHLREQAIIYYAVLFHDGDPGVSIRDRLTWLDGGGKQLYVTGIHNAGGRGATFRVVAEHHPQLS